MKSKVAKMSLNGKNKFIQVTLFRFEGYYEDSMVPAQEDTWTKVMELEPGRIPVSVGNLFLF